MHPTDATPLDAGSPHGRGVAERPDSATERRLWFGILAAPAAWTIAEITGVSIIGRACGASGASGDLMAWQWAGLLGVSAAAAVVALGGLLVAVGVFRRWSDARITRAEGWNRVEFMALGGAIISTFLLLNIIYFAVMPLVVDPCLRST